MTEEQLAKLKEMDIPYCPSAFRYNYFIFGRYINYMRLASFRDFKWKDSEYLEQTMGRNWTKGYYIKLRRNKK